MLGSWEFKISIMVDEEYQWCYRVRFIGSQYLRHGGREALVVLPS